MHKNSQICLFQVCTPFGFYQSKISYLKALTAAFWNPNSADSKYKVNGRDRLSVIFCMNDSHEAELYLVSKWVDMTAESLLDRLFDAISEAKLAPTKFANQKLQEELIEI